jgi:multicomponent Na+:H+ antiporter subunit C
MIWWLAVGVASTLSAGIYLMLCRDVIRCIIGISLVGAATNLVVFASGWTEGRAVTTPPFVPDAATTLPTAANPLPHALVLTAIVIGFGLVCFSLVLALAIVQQRGSTDSDQLRDAEPPMDEHGKPAILEDDARAITDRKGML